MASNNKKFPDLKLDYCFLQILKHKRSAEEENVYLNFDEFYFEKSTPDGEPNQLNFVSFFQSYVNSFDKKFVVHFSGKALTIQENSWGFGSESRVIYGTIEGGTTNLGGAIKTKNNVSDADAFPLTTDHVEARPYFFLLWIPKDWDRGMLIFQSYSNSSIFNVFQQHLRTFIANGNLNSNMIFSTYVPKDDADKIKKSSVVNSITLRRHNLPSDVGGKYFKFNTKEIEGLSIELKIKGLDQISILRSELGKRIWGDSTSFFDFPEEVEDLGFDEHTDVVVNFDSNGRSNSVAKRYNFKFEPTFYVPDGEVSRNSNGLPIIDGEKGLKSFVIKKLNSIQKEIGYLKHVEDQRRSNS
jgi:hypothetical protein